MKIELIKETEYERGDFFIVQIDGEHVFTSFNKEQAEKKYEAFKNNPELVEKKQEVLKSEEIVVSLPKEIKEEIK